MAVTIVPGSGKIFGIQPEVAGVWTIEGSHVHCSLMRQMQAYGSVEFNVPPGDFRDGWELGWIQVRRSHTSWCEYRGQFDRDGSMLLQVGRVPPVGPVRDTSGTVTAIFTDKSDKDEFKRLSDYPDSKSLTVRTRDRPRSHFPLVQENGLTGKANYLHELQHASSFCTVLTARNPDLAFIHLAHFYWYVSWQCQFQPRVFPDPKAMDWTITPNLEGTRWGARGPVAGGPRDPCAHVLTTWQLESANDISARAWDSVKKPRSHYRREFKHWHISDVRR